MACRDAYKMQEKNTVKAEQVSNKETTGATPVYRLLFGVDSKISAMAVLQNNLTEFEWVTRNKIYPNFWGRNINGENALTKEEIDFLHRKACKVAAIYEDSETKESEEQGKILARKAAMEALQLGIPEGTAIFLELDEAETTTADFMKGYAQGLLRDGYTPGFKANTDATYDFDREYSRGMQTDKEVFDKCLIWAVSPSLSEYDRITTTHLIHPDNWSPFAPSGTTRSDIAVWQYGKDCHPIYDANDTETVFNVDLVKNEQVIIEKMF